MHTPASQSASSSALTELRVRFDRDGFAILPDVITGDALRELRAHIDAVLDGELRPNLPGAGDEFVTQWEPRVVGREDLPRRQRIRVLFHLSHAHAWFRAFSRQPAMLDAVAALIGPDVRYYTDQLFVKPPRVGSEVPWHQDSGYWPAAEPRLLSAWVALDDVTIENGCVRYLPGSHRKALEHHDIETDNPNKTTIRDGLFCAGDEVPAVMSAGSVCFHHSLCVHRSLPNASDLPRRGWVLIYLPESLAFHQPWAFPQGFELIHGEAGDGRPRHLVMTSEG